MDNKKQVILITGASSGIGKAIANYLVKNNYTVYGTSRQKLTDCTYLPVQMDITDKASIEQAITYIIEKESRIDVLINNSGIGIYGALEDTAEVLAKKQMDVNFWGAVYVTNAVLPHMHNHNRGKIITISSMGGIISIPFQGLYCASKFALEGYFEALRLELRNSNINVVRINPGDFRTNFTSNREKAYNSSSPYAQQADKTLTIVENDETNGADPQLIAKKIFKIINKKRVKERYYAGMFWQVLLIKIYAFIPRPVRNWILYTHYQL